MFLCITRKKYTRNSKYEVWILNYIIFSPCYSTKLINILIFLILTVPASEPKHGVRAPYYLYFEWRALNYLYFDWRAMNYLYFDWSGEPWFNAFFTSQDHLDLHFCHIVFGRILGVFHDFIQQHWFDLEVIELADVSTAQDGFLLVHEIPNYKHPIHKSMRKLKIPVTLNLLYIIILSPQFNTETMNLDNFALCLIRI